MRTVSLALMLLFCSGRVFCQDYSIAGLTFGMTSSEVRAKLGPKYVEQVSKQIAHPGEPVPSVLQQFTSQGFQGTTHDGFSLEYVDDKLFYIQHQIRWPDEKDPPSYDQTVHDLLAKFGNTTTTQTKEADAVRANSAGMLWEWDLSGHPKAARTPCEAQVKSYFISALPALSFPTGTHPGCGIVAQASVQRSNGTRAYLSDLIVTVIDEGKFYDAIVRQAARLRGEQSNQEDKAKTRKAPL